MTTKREKGLEFQRWVAKYLEERKFIVRNFPMSGKFVYIKDEKTGKPKRVYVSTKNDVFGCDLVARKESESRIKKVYWIQATLHPQLKKRLSELLKYFKFLLPGERVQLWVKNKKGEINIKELDLDNDKFIEIGKIIRRKFYKVGES